MVCSLHIALVQDFVARLTAERPERRLSHGLSARIFRHKGSFQLWHLKVRSLKPFISWEIPLSKNYEGDFISFWCVSLCFPNVRSHSTTSTFPGFDYPSNGSSFNPCPSMGWSDFSAERSILKEVLRSAFCREQVIGAKKIWQRFESHTESYLFLIC